VTQDHKSKITNISCEPQSITKNSKVVTQDHTVFGIHTPKNYYIGFDPVSQIEVHQ